MNAQLRLPLSREPSYGAERFVASSSNAEARGALEGFAKGSMALVGPEGAGKTHLAHIWAERHDARFVDTAPELFDDLDGERLVVENADAWPDEALFHLINMAQAEGAVLLTARQAPALWPTALPDLRSRLNALPVAELQQPDDVVLGAVLKVLFEERHIRPAPDLIPYLIWRMERSVPAARAVVEQLDLEAAARGREINRALAVKVLEVDNVINDLFDDED